MKRYKVIAWGPGPVGAEALASIIQHPDLDLVGLRVYSEAKVGRDAGDLVGLAPTGVLGTTDTAALLALGADCVCFTASDMYGFESVVGEICRILTAGVNVVDVTGTLLGYPSLVPGLEPKLAEACRAGGSSFYYGGLNPGFAMDVLPALLASGTQRVDSIELVEYFDLSSAPADVLPVVGFSLTPEEDREKVDPAVLSAYWTPNAHLIAQALGTAITGMEVEREVVLAKEAFTTPTGLVVPAGTVEAFHVTLKFSVGDTVRIVTNERMRVAPSWKAPWPAEWPPAPGGVSGYQVIVHGEPTTKLELTFAASASAARWEAGDPCGGALTWTGARLANAIPTVCEAPSGVYNPISLPRPVHGRVNW